MSKYTRCGECGILSRSESEQKICNMIRGPYAPEGLAGTPCIGELTIEPGCHAVLFHGPGHQSTTRCGLPEDGHNIHEAIPMNRVARWRGDESYSGYFDEYPDED